MRQLPKFAILTNNDIPGIKVISLQHPYIIASVHDFRRDDEQVAERLDDMAQERFPIAKIPGYTIFLTMYTSLKPTNNKALQQVTLDEMAQFFYEQKVLSKPGLYMKCEESGKLEKKILRESEIRKRNKKEKQDNNQNK